jgi:nucleotide-binding universal stress UspA family protein
VPETKAQTQERPATDASVQPHTLTSILVHVEPGVTASHRVEVAARLAREYDARLIGLGAETIDAIPAADPFMGYVTAEWIALANQQVGADIQNAEAAFRRDAAGAEVEWRQVQDFPSHALARAARAADLVVVDAKGADAGSSYRKADPADVIMTSGRPVLVTPAGGSHLKARTIVIAWKDTREARRAVADAMPFLKRAEQVIVQAVCPGDQMETAGFQTSDVANALKRHGVPARPNVTKGHGDEAAGEIQRIAALNEADLIVAGAYGHARAAEWAFGGVTRDLLHDPQRFILMSH